MIFSTSDIDVLRLLRWCRYADPEDLARVFGEAALANLSAFKLIHAQKYNTEEQRPGSAAQKSGKTARKTRKAETESDTAENTERESGKGQKNCSALTLTGKGSEFLDTILPGIPPEVPKTYRNQDIRRRIRVSRVALTGYRSGAALFNSSMTDLRRSPSFYMPVIARGQGSNPWSNSRIASVARLGDLLAAIHYVCPRIGKLYLTDEMNSFNNNTSQIERVRRILIFGGESYKSVLTALEELPDDKESKLISYADAYRRTGLAVHLLPCSDTGALQLRLMSQTDYRRRLTAAALRAQYEPPPPEHPEWDALFQGKPFVMAADMNLRRIDEVIRSAKELNLIPISMAALPEQAEEVLNVRYRDAHLARVFMLSEEAVKEVASPVLHAPPSTQFETPEGGVVNVPLIQTAGKAGRPPRK